MVSKAGTRREADTRLQQSTCVDMQGTEGGTVYTSSGPWIFYNHVYKYIFIYIYIYTD